MNDFLDHQGKDVVIGIDLGGTNFRAALFRGLREGGRDRGEHSASTEPELERREPVGDERSPEAIVARLATIVTELTEEAGLRGPVPVGIGFAGMLRGADGFVVNSPHLYWRNVAFGEKLRETLGERHPIAIHNDVNAITYGEYAAGAARGHSNVFAVFVGTGIGGGAIVGDRIYVGSSGCAAEIGHTKVVFDDSARPCACGLTGCVEAYGGGEALQKRARLELSQGVRSLATRLAGSPDRVNPGHLDAAAADGDEYALALFAEVAPMLGVAIANAVTLFNPSCLVLGGGVLSRTPVLREHVIAAFNVAVNPPASDGLEIADSVLGDNAGLVGSALLASG